MDPELSLAGTGPSEPKLVIDGFVDYPFSSVLNPVLNYHGFAKHYNSMWHNALISSQLMY